MLSGSLAFCQHHLVQYVQCCLTGADVGGFFGNADSELLVRWNQLGTYYPFFRGHGHLETKRREPWLFGEDNTRRNRDSLRERYALLPYLYTLFWESHTQGTPIMRPLWYEFPEVSALWTDSVSAECSGECTSESAECRTSIEG